MKILHRVSLNVETDKGFASDLREIGVLTEEDTGSDSMGVVAFEIVESDPNWPEVARLIEQYQPLVFTQTFFDEDELLEAEFVRLFVTYEHGYPQPEATWVRQKPNYEVLCPECGLFKQVKSFTIKVEPKLRGNHFMTLIWGSPVFATNEVVAKLEESGISGFNPVEVMVQESGQPTDKIMQLLVAEETEPGFLDQEKVGYEQCDSCGQRKYFAHRRGVMKYRRDAIPPNVDMIETAEWFGAGSRKAYKEVLISNRMTRMILDEGWKGVLMKVVELVD